MLFLVALLMMLAAVLSVLRARRLEQVARVNQRLAEVAFLTPDTPLRRPTVNPLLEELDRWLKRVGLNVSPAIALLVLAAAVAFGVLLWQQLNPLVALAWWALSIVLTVLVPQVRYRQRVNKIISQIPLFIDQVVRGLVTGRNLEGAIKLAAEDLQMPLRELIMKAQKNVELGADLGDALKDVAHFHDIKELHLLALTIHSSRVYGGSPRDMLESIVNLIRQREQAQEELRAMTGETRVTAWVLGATPGLLVAYILWQSPAYMMSMWHDSTGQTILVAGAVMQALGVLVMWRMIKSL
ncbi:type II secretion system F family protein [Aquabacterium sp.]|uniref:type II secretion system F family protein n=1 Tax=Aquabacterium sp. TaxID=1872578 RepID=UPI002487C6AC|nr:type II secretion system F family protein [Aquabacterium sp.]MDI1351010.1 type II secretion system F family protein [Aquabacterium sp.]